MRALALALALVMHVLPALAQSERVVEIGSRGVQTRAVLIEPSEAVGSVILLAGGNGRLDITPDGRIWRLVNNQLVYTRSLYAKQGYLTLVPDLAPDLKTEKGVVDAFRVSAAHAQDIGAMVEYLRKLKPPVVLIGTSRGTISVANAVVRLDAGRLPDAAIITSPSLARPGSKDASVQSAAGDPSRITVPFLVVSHRRDKCPDASPEAVQAFKTWYERSGRKLDLIVLDGSAEVVGNPCDAQSPHGFMGLDQQVVGSITGWIRDKGLTR